MEEIKPGWTNGKITLLDPVERGWITNEALAKKAGQLALAPEPEPTNVTPLPVREEPEDLIA